LRLIKGEKDGRAYEFAGCDADTKKEKVCGFTASTQSGALIKILVCPKCSSPMRPVRRKDGGHSWVCSSCTDNPWYLADASWKIVTAPTCQKCRNYMSHRERSSQKGTYFWGCFPCDFFLDADVFGTVLPTKTRKRESSYAHQRSH
jgi:ssDNA-binding Zn-finger/Zn-ribbon topoisomerase 1